MESILWEAFIFDSISDILPDISSRGDEQDDKDTVIITEMNNNGYRIY